VSDGSELKSARRVVIKIGSRLLAEDVEARVGVLAAEARACSPIAACRR
jgi:hypothetical protein